MFWAAKLKKTALGRQRQKDRELKASLGYTEALSQKKKTKQTNKKICLFLHQSGRTVVLRTVNYHIYLYIQYTESLGVWLKW
jgi:hypothetical protein